jgi:uncharacterized membrane protein
MNTGRLGYTDDMAVVDHGRSVLGPALTMGVGFGGLVEGIALRQILGWHHVLSSRPQVDSRANEMADGAFHALCGLVLLGGVLWLYARLRQPPVAAAWPRLAQGHRPWRALVGPMVMGWGLFNLVEGLIDHHLLGLHHVRPGPGQLGWDLAFLASGVALTAVGYLVARSVAPAAERSGAADTGPS